MRREDMIKGIHSGVGAACKEYGKWSSGESIHDRGVESLLVSWIARRIIKKWKDHRKMAYLSLETPFSEVKEKSRRDQRNGAPPKRPSARGPRPKVLRGLPRADLVLYTPADRVSGIIEVKRKWQPSSCHKDLKRLRALVSRYGPRNNGTVQMGFLVTMVVVAPLDLKTKIKEIRTSVRDIQDDAVSVKVHTAGRAAYVDAELGKKGYSVVIEVVSRRVKGEIIEDEDPTPEIET